LEQYQKCAYTSSPEHLAGAAVGNAIKHPSVVPDGDSDLLVNKCISRQKTYSKNPVKSLQLWPRSIKLVRDFKRQNVEPPGDLRGEITGFSQASKRRLKFTASNAFPQLVSQFGMTYHKTSPDGRTVKRHMDIFRRSISRKFPGVGYLWILEFQTRKTPHYHLFLSLPHDTPGLHKYLAEKWHKIAEPDSKQHLRFHAHKSNFIAWDMGSGSYLCKYLDKEHQKAVPQGFTGVGRFWGNSRGLVPPALEIDMGKIDCAYSWENVDMKTGEVNEFKASEYITRQLCRHHEKSIRRSPWKSSARKRPTSYTLPSGSAIYLQLEKYIEKQMGESAPF
jgi:hypothetical protein